MMPRPVISLNVLAGLILCLMVASDMALGQTQMSSQINVPGSVSDNIPGSVPGNSQVKAPGAQQEPALSITQAERDYLTKKGAVKVCIDPDWMPNEQIDQTGTYVGISSDYMAMFSEMLGIAIVLHPTSDWRETVDAAKARRCDLVSLINRSEERESFLDFTAPYLSYAYVFVTQEAAPYIDDITHYADKTFSVVKGYRVGQKVREAYPNLTVIEVASTAEGQEMVLNGAVFAHIDTSVVQTYVARVNGYSGLKSAGMLPWKSAMSLATRNDEPLLGQIFQKAVQSIPPSEHVRIRNKWIAATVEKVFDTTLLFQILGAVTAFILIVALWGITLWRSRQALERAHAKLEEQAAELEKFATTDSLTQLLNRRALTRNLDEEVLRFERYGHSFGMMLIDIDHFKRINDAHGHQVGDMFLQEFSSLLLSLSRATDYVGRWGGEEFLVLCPETDLAGLQDLAEKLCGTISTKRFETVGKTSASFGLSVFQEGDTPETLLERADRALYRAKENGRDQVCLG